MNNCILDKALIAICVVAIIAVCYVLDSKKEKYEPVEQKDEYKEIKEEEKKEEGGWWDNVINCKKNGDNNFFCKPKEKWIFPY